jgi:hypothetical protein
VLGFAFGSWVDGVVVPVCEPVWPEVELVPVPVCDVLLLVLGFVDDVCDRAKAVHSSRNIVVNRSFFMNHIPPGPVVKGALVEIEPLEMRLLTNPVLPDQSGVAACA